MYAFVAATLASAALVSAQTGLTINTPSSVVECQPAALAWTGGTAPYFLSVIPGGQPGAAALETFPDQTGTSFTWSAVDIASGTSITVQLRDSTGTLAYTDAVTIQAGSSTSCVKGGSSGASASGSAAPAASAASSGSAAAAGSTNRSSAAGAASGSGSASASAPSASGSRAPTSGAEKVGAGVFGVAVAALIAAFA